MRRIASRLALVAGAAALMVPPAEAQEGFSRSSASEPHALEINTLLFTRSGHGVALWRGFDQARGASLYPAFSLGSVTGAWRRGPGVAGFGSAPGEVFAYGRSRLLLVGLRPNGKSGRRVRQAPAIAYGKATDGSFGRPRLLAADAHGTVPSADVNPSGDALVAWPGGNAIRVAERSARRGFEQPHTRTPRLASRAAVAINARGDRVLAWYRKGRIEARIRKRGHGWGRTLPIGHASPYPDRLEATIGANGQILIAWGAASIREGRPTLADVRVSIRDRTRWVQYRLDRFRTTAPFPPDPRAIPVIDSRGLVWIAWTGLAEGQPVVKLARVSGDVVGQPGVMSAPGGALDDAAAGLQGQIGLTWSTVTPGGTSTPFLLLRTAAGALGPVIPLAAPGETAIAGTQVAFDPVTGRPSVAWLLRAAQQATLVVSTGPAPAP